MVHRASGASWPCEPEGVSKHRRHGARLAEENMSLMVFHMATRRAVA